MLRGCPVVLLLLECMHTCMRSLLSFRTVLSPALATGTFAAYLLSLVFCLLVFLSAVLSRTEPSVPASPLEGPDPLGMPLGGCFMVLFWLLLSFSCVCILS